MSSFHRGLQLGWGRAGPNPQARPQQGLGSLPGWSQGREMWQLSSLRPQGWVSR